MARPVAAPAPRRPNPGPALLLMVGGLLLVLAVQLYAPDNVWLRVGAVVVALGAPLGFLVVSLRRHAAKK